MLHVTKGVDKNGDFDMFPCVGMKRMVEETITQRTRVNARESWSYLDMRLLTWLRASNGFLNCNSLGVILFVSPLD